MNNLPYIAFYPSKWLAKTAQLSAVERGVFITLICEMYEQMEPLKNDSRRLARLCGCTPATFKKCLQILLEDRQKIVLQGDRIWNFRVEKEIKSAQKKSKMQSEKIQKRWEKPSENKARAIPRYYQPEPEPYKHIKPTEIYDRSGANQNPSDFVFYFDGKGGRWGFTQGDVECLQVVYPNQDVAGKLGDVGFLKWADKQSDNPVQVVENWFRGQDNKSARRGELSGRVTSLGQVLERVVN